MKRWSFVLFSCAVLFGFKALAGVQFLPSASGSVGQLDASNAADRCKNAGYTYTSCGAGSYVLGRECPWNASYTDACCVNNILYTTNYCAGTSPDLSNPSCMPSGTICESN
ncbi:MAG: hypothetical protein J6X42_00065 [Alphaproteobacteria bacterium]|nr:hypothetical protein [Alphaproteobacteria bacterium]